MNDLEAAKQHAASAQGYWTAALEEIVLALNDHPAELLGELLMLRATIQAAITDVTLRIQKEHPGALV